MTLPPAVRARLKPVLMMLTAPTEGDRQNAVEAVTKMLTAAIRESGACGYRAPMSF